MAIVHAMVDMVGVVAILVVVVAALGRFHVRFAISIDTMLLYAIINTLTQVNLLFHHHELPSIPTWWLHAPLILPHLDTHLLQGQRHPSIFNHMHFSQVQIQVLTTSGGILIQVRLTMSLLRLKTCLILLHCLEMNKCLWETTKVCPLTLQVP